MAAVKRVLVTGGGSYIGDAIASALLAEGAEVTLLVRPGAEQQLGALAQRTRWFTADVWEPSSLKGRARGIQIVVHAVGGMIAEPARGLTYQYLNLVSARNVANMCVSGGVPQMVLLSAARAPWLPAGYVRSKRDAEAYLSRVGLKSTIIRLPLAYSRGEPRPLLYRGLSLMGALPPFSWLGMRQVAPLPVDVIARGCARIILADRPGASLYRAADIRRMNSRRELRRGYGDDLRELPIGAEEASPISLLDDEQPFGWTPPGSD